jgi:branched-chain amino acid transport system substrate-binding protein
LVIRPAPPPKPALTVKIGHSAPLTGPQAHLGKDNENGARLAIEEPTPRSWIGGAMVKFELLGEDDQADPKQGTTVAQKLIDAGVNGVIGHLNSGTTIPGLASIYSDAGMPQVSPSATNPKYTQQGFKTAFRVIANDVQQGKVLGDYATGSWPASDRHHRRPHRLRSGLADEFEKAAKAGGAAIVAREFTNDKATDFAAILTKIKSKKPTWSSTAAWTPRPARWRSS